MKKLTLQDQDRSAIEALQWNAAKDRALRQALVADAAEALLRHDIRLPEDTVVHVVDAKPDEVFIVLPPPPAEGEVSDEDLATVNGGATPIVAVTVVVTIHTAVSAVGALGGFSEL